MKKLGDTWGNWQYHVFLILAIVLLGLPLYYAFMMSTQSLGETLANPLLPGKSLADNLERVIASRLHHSFANSIAASLTIAAGKTILSLLAGLAFSFFRFRGKWIVFAAILFTLMMPGEVLVIALFRVVSGALGWGNSFAGLVAPSLASAAGTFLFRQHFESMPSELSEAAQMDGMNPLQYLGFVLIPLSWNTIGALFVISFLAGWNMYLWPLMIITDPAKQVVQVGLGFITQSDGLTAENLGPLMLGAVVSSIPPLIVFMAMQRQFMRGFAISRDK